MGMGFNKIGRKDAVPQSIKGLARELGVIPTTIRRKLDKGMTEEQIRADARKRAETIAAGGTVRGRVTGTRLDPRSGRHVAPAEKPFGQTGTVPAIGLKERLAARMAERTVGPNQTLLNERTVEWKRALLPPAAGDRPGPETKIAAELRKEVALASLRELELRQKSGDLSDVGYVNAWMGTCIVAARNAFLRIGPELRDRLAAETDPVRIEGLINMEVERGLGMLKLLDRPVGIEQAA